VSSEAQSTRVLIVDDEREVADIYALRLEEEEYDVETTYGGEAALEILDETVDVVLLDRRMPELPGDEVLAEIQDSECEPRIIMLTAVEPGPDIIDMDFHDYLRKPVDKESLVDAIDQQLRVRRHEGHLGEYLEVRSKLALLSVQLPPKAEELDKLRERAARLESELDDSLGEFESVEDLTSSFGGIDGRVS
jgi:DNA-binding response OmpR family regulator